MIFEGFIGSSYVSPAMQWDAQRAINLYVENDESGKAKDSRAMLGTPGLLAFATLPTSPVRGIWTGLADNLPGSTLTDLCFAVAGSKLYQVFSGGSYALLGDVGDDGAHTPVTFQVDGVNILVTSAGLAWIYDGNSLTLDRAYINNGMGTSTTSLLDVTWTSGDPFYDSLAGGGILIDGLPYVVFAVNSETSITLFGAFGPPNPSNTFRIMGGGGQVNVDSSGSHVSWLSGDLFDTLAAGDYVVIFGSTGRIGSIQDSKHLTLVAPVTPSLFNVDIQFAPAVKAAMSAFLDGYFATIAPASTTFRIGIGKAFDALDFGRKAAFPDAIASILDDHEELWLFGSETTEVWRNTGAADFPFERDPGGFIEQGICAPFSACSLANGVAWLGGDTRGPLIAWYAEGFQPQRISTHGVETAWATYSTVSDAIGFAYVMRGHQFWVLNFPSANATWVYDRTTKEWHERGWWNGSSIDRVRYTTHAYGFKKHLVGDWQTGAVYQLSEAAFTDAGTTIHRIRTSPHFTREQLWSFIRAFRLATRTGLGPTLSWSDDLGGIWHAEVSASSRPIGGALQSSEWRRLGKTRDRIFRVTFTDTAAAVSFYEAYIDFK